MIQKDRVPQMHASIKTVAFRGIDTIPVEVQVHVANGLPAMAIVGLADKAVAESRERVRAALASIGLALPPKRIAINLAPADVLKEGAHYDLPIALGLLVAIGTVPASRCLRRGFPDCCHPCPRARRSMSQCFIRLPASFPPAG